MNLHPKYPVFGSDDSVTVRGLAEFEAHCKLLGERDVEPHHLDLYASCRGRNWRLCIVAPTETEAASYLYLQTERGEIAAPGSGDVWKNTMREQIAMALIDVVDFSERVDPAQEAPFAAQPEGDDR